ncbi:hypothetical protein Micbo1qcDRAFT_224729 [Microdochium bolleyi]|uniref:Uncharacterized protein n=1 Tax=Microdochium bolleyi TaxID=196109 RepID=A0A136IJI7_9PEZI|nr:hypothetical protein Micbo1qcDRAFT_224729 [Microdochium bolleyi]
MTPLPEMLSLRDYGRVIARTDTPSYFLYWSDDLQKVSYGDSFTLSMDAFRRLSMHFKMHAEELYEELMLGLEVDADLAKVKDDLYGFSFVSHPYNQLTHAYAQVFKQACMTASAVLRYQKKAERLIELLAGCIHTTGGQTGRSPELFSLTYQNSALGERGVYIYNGSVMTLTRQHKAKLMFRYLVSIRPFVTRLRQEPAFMQRSPVEHTVSSPLLFSSDINGLRPWDASKLSAIFRKATSLYRQITIGITEKHVAEIATPSNRYDDVGPDASINAVFAWQSSHRLIQRANTYGLDGAFPTQLQPALLRIYEWKFNFGIYDN